MNGDGYRYHVFLSYRRSRRERDQPRDNHVEEWVASTFVPQLQNDLTEALGEPSAIFLDTDEIGTGQDWERALVEALRASYCIVPVWSSLYFRSEWCVSEWCTFRRRNVDLVIPIRWQRAVTLPKGASRYQVRGFSEFTFRGDHFLKTEAFLRFQRETRSLASEIQQRIDRAPPFDPASSVVVPQAPPALNWANVIRLRDLPDFDDVFLKDRMRVTRADIRLDRQTGNG
jgi:hypothetical protein